MNSLLARRSFPRLISKSFPPRSRSITIPAREAFESLTPTFFEPLSSTLLSFSPSIGLSYAVLIPIIGLALRFGFTLPITIWQRNRTRKFIEVVVPEIRAAQEIARFSVRKESREAKLDYEQYKVAYKKRATEVAAKITAVHKVKPLVTMIVPPLLHIPILITATLVLRDAAQRSLSSLPYLPTSPEEPVSLALTQLQDFAATPFLWCDSLVLTDPTMALPAIVTLALYLNVETASKYRAAVASAMGAVEEDRMEDVQIQNSVASKKLTGAQLREEAVRVWQMQNKRGYATMQRRRRVEVPEVIPKPQIISPEPKEKSTQKMVTNILRGSSIIFFLIAAQAPTAVCIYWLTSNLFTLGQSTIFAYFDQQRESERVEKRLRLKS